MLVDEQCWRFGPFSLDRRRRLLSARGRPVKLDAKAFDLLEYLVSRRDESPTREEILAHVWRGTTVSEGNLAVQLSALRRVLADHGGDHKLILTLPGRRYRFVADLLPHCEPHSDTPADTQPALPDRLHSHACEDADSAVQKTSFRKRAGAATAFLVALATAWLVWHGPFAGSPKAGPPAIMVLPFQNLSAPSDDYLADGITDDLTTGLARLPGSLVISRETARTYAGRRLAASEIGHALKVRYLLEGGVFADGHALRINARLTDTKTDALLWTKTFSVPRERMTEARDIIVGRMVATLGPVFVRAESRRSERERPENPDAVDLLLRARWALDRGDLLADYQAGQRLLEAALREQPDFTEALAEFAWLLVCKLSNVDDPDQDADIARARQVIAQALLLAPDNGRALSAQGRLRAIEGDYAGAIASARAALAVQPNDVDADWVLGLAEYYLGHLDAASAAIEASLRIDPEGPHSRQRYQRLGSIQLFGGHVAEALASLHAASAGDVLPAPGQGDWNRIERTRLMLISAYAQTDQEKARALYASYSRIWPNRSVWRFGALAPKTLAALPGFQHFLDGLSQAGMPRFADETQDDHLAPSATDLTGGDFAPTPLSVPGATTLRTETLRAWLRGGRAVLIIDVGTGTAVIDGAVWRNNVAGDVAQDAFAEDTAAAFLARSPGAPVVVMADGTYGVSSYNTALHLASHLSGQVYWYRGGEEAWAKAGLPGAYRRSD